MCKSIHIQRIQNFIVPYWLVNKLSPFIYSPPLGLFLFFFPPFFHGSRHCPCSCWANSCLCSSRKWFWQQCCTPWYVILHLQSIIERHISLMLSLLVFESPVRSGPVFCPQGPWTKTKTGLSNLTLLKKPDRTGVNRSWLVFCGYKTGQDQSWFRLVRDWSKTGLNCTEMGNCTKMAINK